MKYGSKWLLKAISIAVLSLIVIASPCSMIVDAAGAADTTRPSTPASLKASSIGQTSLTLTWTKSTDNVGVRSYAIYRDHAYLAYSATNSYQVTGLKPGTSYTFYVAAQDMSWNLSKASNTITVKTLSSSFASTAAKAATVAAPAGSAATASSASTSTAASTTKKVIGYYASWASYSGYTPSDIPVANLTHILYAFAKIDSSYHITLGDTDVDAGNLAELKAVKAKHPGLKTLISVGGWEWSERFSDMALTGDRRTAFANSVVSFLRKYGLDGVDLDWEYPVGGGQYDNAERAADKTNFTLLLQCLRSKLDAAGTADGKKYLLSIAGGADTDYVSHVQLSAIAKYLDFATVMTYDIHGPFDSYTDLNAPLYPTTGSSPQDIWSADQAVKAWVAAGFPKSKLVMGVPFYGYLYSGVSGGGSGLLEPYSSAKAVNYDDVVSQYLTDSSYTRYYASQGKTPCLFNGSTFISYEDATSLKTKAAYIDAQGLAGAGIWELSENADGTLLAALRAGLK